VGVLSIFTKTMYGPVKLRRTWTSRFHFSRFPAVS
jgi:hypothetical protein